MDKLTINESQILIYKTADDNINVNVILTFEKYIWRKRIR